MLFRSVDPSTCGLGVLNGANGTPQDVNSPFSVIADGKDIVAGSNSFCGDHTLAHEFGHNMGLEHDRANATGQGVFPYSYGYGIAGVFGDIMSYIYPKVQKFSNPAINCATNQPCGIVETDPVNAANNALSLNNTRFTIAGFVAPTGLDTTPNTFSFTNLSGVNAGDPLASEYKIGRAHV